MKMHLHHLMSKYDIFHALHISVCCDSLDIRLIRQIDKVWRCERQSCGQPDIPYSQIVDIYCDGCTSYSRTAQIKTLLQPINSCDMIITDVPVKDAPWQGVSRFILAAVGRPPTAAELAQIHALSGRTGLTTEQLKVYETGHIYPASEGG